MRVRGYMVLQTPTRSLQLSVILPTYLMTWLFTQEICNVLPSLSKKNQSLSHPTLNTAEPTVNSGASPQNSVPALLVSCSGPPSEQSSSSSSSSAQGQSSDWVQCSFSVCLWNSRSTDSKHCNFQAFVYSPSFHIVALTKTWLSPLIVNGEVLPSAFTVYWYDRATCGGSLSGCSFFITFLIRLLHLPTLNHLCWIMYTSSSCV